MPNSFTQQKFLGATVASFRVSAGWQEQQSKMDIVVYEDKSDPDYPDDFWLKEENVQNINGRMIGTPVRFQFGDFIFDGLLESFDQEISTAANPGYTVTLTSPVKVLDAVQIIMSNYVGPTNDSSFNATAQGSLTFNVSNILNVYGYLEDGGDRFGGSNLNETGILWNGSSGVKSALETLSSTTPVSNTVPDAYKNFGSYIVYRNNYYQLDLSALPTPPDYYRIGGGVINWNLLEMISQFCQDGGVDYIVTLQLNESNSTGPHTIGFKTVNRVIQPTLGQLSPFIRQHIGIDLSQATHGHELRSDVTQTMLVGGEINTISSLYQANPGSPSIVPFWGFDIDGNPIVGVKSSTDSLSSYYAGPYYADDDLIMNLNASPIADILAAIGMEPSWQSTILEMRCVLGGYDTWALYMNKYNPTLAFKIGVLGAVNTGPDLNPGVNIGLFNQVTQLNMLDLINDGTLFATKVSRMTRNLVGAINSPLGASFIVYNYLLNQAQTYYGKKFLVILPFQVQLKITDVGNVFTSYEIADAGFSPESSQLLGLSFLNENYFLDSTGRFRPFLRFQFYNDFYPVSLIGKRDEEGELLAPRRIIADLNEGTEDYLVQSDSYTPNIKIFAELNPDSELPITQNDLSTGGSPIVFVNIHGVLQPAIVVSIPNAIFGLHEDMLGNYIDLADLMNVDPDALLRAIQRHVINFPFAISPPAIYPDATTVALKSNQYLYGPWGKYGADGKTNFEQDETLVPWNYGGYDLMNQAALAKIQNVPMGNQVLERANITFAGMPSANIGDVLVAGGPIVTSITCSVDTNGVTTQYVMETFVNRVGSFIRENADRLRRIGQSYQKLRRSIRQIVLSKINKKNTLGAMISAGSEYYAKSTYAMTTHSPHGAIVANLLYDDVADIFVPNVGAQTHYESVANINLYTSGIFERSACVGLEALFRPFTMDSGNYYLPLYIKSTGLPQTVENKITSIELNPYQNLSDLTWCLSSISGEYMGLKAKNADLSYAAAVSFKGPIVIEGWGYDIIGKPVPNSGNLKDISYIGISGLTGMVPDLDGPFASSSMTHFYPNYLQKSVFWPVGPLDVRWDKFRGVWSSPGMVLCGQTVGILSPGATGLMRIFINDIPTDEEIIIKNYFKGINANINSGVNIICGYDPLTNIWRPIAADC